MQYDVLNSNVLIKEIKAGGLTIAGQDENPNAVLTGEVMLYPKSEKIRPDLTGKTVYFIRGMARKIKLDADYYLVKKEDLLLYKKD